MYKPKWATNLLKIKKEIRKIKKKVKVLILSSCITINQLSKIINLKNKHQMQEEVSDRLQLRTLTAFTAISNTLIIFPNKNK